MQVPAEMRSPLLPIPTTNVRLAAPVLPAARADLAPPGDDGCGSQPNATLVGVGYRMVAVRGGHDAGVWTSWDGLMWQRLPVSGDIPSEQAMNAVLLPGGVLLSDRTATWFGEAVTK